MKLESLDHYSIRAADVAAAQNFYGSLLGLVPGARPQFPFPGVWLYRADAQGLPVGGSVVHVIGTAGDSSLTDFLGDKGSAAEGEAAGTGQLDHIAFRASGLTDMLAMLRSRSIPFKQRRVPGMDLHLLFLLDPCGVTVELNYTGADDLAATTAP